MTMQSLPLADSGAGTRGAVVRLLAAVRVVQLIPWPIAMLTAATSGLQRPGLAVAVWVAQSCWCLGWAAIVVSRNGIPRWAMTADVAVATAALVLAGFACYPLDAVSWANSAITPAIGTAAAAACAWPLIESIPAVVLLALAYGAGSERGLRESGDVWAGVIGNVVALAGFAAVAAVLCRLFVRQGVGAAAAQAAQAELAAARARDALEAARERERARQYRMLHDTVLSTLSAIARGGLDPGDPLVRQRCAADADYLRALITSGGVSAGNRLQGELAAIGRSQAALGLRVHLHSAEVAAELPDEVIRAVADATREALNNVIKHSGAQQAWVTALGAETGPGLTVTITDRGSGFDAASTAQGLGLRDSVGGRMAEIGGAMSIDSTPGQGTTVELRWPR